VEESEFKVVAKEKFLYALANGAKAIRNFAFSGFG
jgi:hypothetical protein